MVVVSLENTADMSRVVYNEAKVPSVIFVGSTSLVLVSASRSVDGYFPGQTSLGPSSARVLFVQHLRFHQVYGGTRKVGRPTGCWSQVYLHALSEPHIG